MISRDFVPGHARTLVHRHLAWLTVLRYELRGPNGMDLTLEEASARVKLGIVTVLSMPAHMSAWWMIPNPPLSRDRIR